MKLPTGDNWEKAKGLLLAKLEAKYGKGSLSDEIRFGEWANERVRFHYFPDDAKYIKQAGHGMRVEVDINVSILNNVPALSVNAVKQVPYPLVPRVGWQRKEGSDSFDMWTFGQHLVEQPPVVYVRREPPKRPKLAERSVPVKFKSKRKHTPTIIVPRAGKRMDVVFYKDAACTQPIARIEWHEASRMISKGRRYSRLPGRTHVGGPTYRLSWLPDKPYPPKTKAEPPKAKV